jgi:hypothetical protein
MFEFLKRIFGRPTDTGTIGVATATEVKPVPQVSEKLGSVAQDQALEPAPVSAPRKTSGRKSVAKPKAAQDTDAPKKSRPSSRRTKKS